MKPFPPIFYLTLITLCLHLNAELAVSIEPGAGYKTSLPSGNDSTYKNYPFAAITLCPEGTVPAGKQWKTAIDVDAEYARYIDGPAEWNIDPSIIFSRQTSTQRTKLGLTGGYYSTPSSIDPTIPQKYSILSLFAEHTTGIRMPVAVYYSLTAISDAASDRMDYKNSFKCKMSWKLSHSITAFIKPGILWNVSDYERFSYLQPILSCGWSWALSEHDFCIGQAFAGYPFYGTVTIKKSGKSKGQINKPEADSSNIVHPRVPHTMLSCVFSHEINDHADFSISYDMVMLDPGSAKPIYVSHRIGCSVEYRIARLLPID